VPRKNARLLCGKPLLAYTAESALSARLLTRVVLSTDDAEIAEIGKGCGLEVPFTRPAELAGDDTPMLPVVQHTLKWMEERGDRFDAVCLLQPTNPLRRSADIDACIELIQKCDADAVVTVLPVPLEHHPYWVYFQDPSGMLRLSNGETNPIPRRQQLPPAFHREGSVYVTRRDVVMEMNSLYGSRLVGYQLSDEDSVNIDSQADWEKAENLIARLEASVAQHALHDRRTAETKS
jgi:CMP-N,N'-diacetyllegionaminic acid synthase